VTQARVLKAVCQGYRSAPAIAQAAGVGRQQVYTYLGRLAQMGCIYVAPSGRKSSYGKGHRPIGFSYKEYHLKDIGCLLADFWREGE
jgi:DNA-binding IclR family transcriptional regulator